MRYPPHRHFCSNKDRGCEAAFFCSALPIDNGDGTKNCPYDNDVMHCESCIEASSCDDCGAYDHLLESHDDRCSLSPLQRDDSPEAKGVDVEIDDSWGTIPEAARGMFSMRDR